MSHTPGPWVAGNTADSIIVPEDRPAEEILRSGGRLIAESIEPRNRPLIIAAPDLLAALRGGTVALEQCITNPITAYELDLARRAIANSRAAIDKAEGRGS